MNRDGKWRPSKRAQWNSWMPNFYPPSVAVFCCFVKKKKEKAQSTKLFYNNGKSTKLLYNNGKSTKQLSFPFLRNYYWKWRGSAAPGHLIPLQIKSTGGSREGVKGKRTPEEMDFWFHPRAPYHLQQVQEQLAVLPDYVIGSTTQLHKLLETLWVFAPLCYEILHLWCEDEGSSVPGKENNYLRHFTQNS